MSLDHHTVSENKEMLLKKKKRKRKPTVSGEGEGNLSKGQEATEIGPNKFQNRNNFRKTK